VYYKVEAYTASEKAGRILYQNGITPTYVSDNPVLNSQHVVFEAAKAYGNGLPYHAALAGVTSAPAELLGLGHRLGKIKEGYDADIVVWDSDPLSAGATPVQVWIDGAPQFEDPIVLKKPPNPPMTPDETLGNNAVMGEVQGNVVFTGVSTVHMNDLEKTFDASEETVAIITDGKITCIGSCKEELTATPKTDTPSIHLKNGYITLPFTAFGSSLGLLEIDAEADTQDGPPPKDGISRAVDGLAFGGKQLASAFGQGVTRAISAPSTGSIEAKGLSVGLNTGARHALDEGAVWNPEVALHYTLTLDAKTDKTPSISSAIGMLRRKLLSAVDELVGKSADESSSAKYEERSYLKRVVSGTLPLVLTVHSADTISKIILLKKEIETAITKSLSTEDSLSHPKLRIILLGGAESHLVAPALASSNISVVLAPLLPHAQTWDQRRGLTGAPLTNGTAIDALLDAGVLVGIGVEEVWETRDLRLLAGIAYANSGGRLRFEDALNLVGGNFEKMLGLDRERNGKGKEIEGDWVVWEGSPLDVGGRVRGVGSMGRTVIWE
jgi:imidazolonepropionase-like amidohydrolase